MNILFDKGSSQVQVQLETGNRLTTLFDAITGQLHSTWSIGPDRLSGEALAGADVLVILTRHQATAPGTTNPFPANWDFAYTQEELQAIQQFVAAGNGLLLISNHGPFSQGSVDWTVNDKVLAGLFGVAINPAAYVSPAGPPMTMSGADLNTATFGSTILSGVTSIAPNDSGAVSSTAGAVIAAIPANAVNKSPTFPNPPAGQSYAVLAPTSTSGQGLVIVGGNSGIAGNAGTNYPAPGRIGTGSDLQFLTNCLAVLGKQQFAGAAAARPAQRSAQA